MELKEFIQETLVQIVESVVTAREKIVESGGDVNPVGGYFDQKSLGTRQWNWKRGATEIVEFDVALTSSDTDEKKAGIGVFLGGIGIGSKVTEEVACSSMSRIKFSVPILLPSHATLKENN